MQSLQTVWASQLVKLFAISACQIVWCVRVLNRMLWCASNSLSNSVSYSPGTYSSKLSVILSAITVWQTLWSANSLANYISVSKTVWQTVHALENSLADSTRSRKQFGKQYTLCKQFGKLFAVFFGSVRVKNISVRCANGSPFAPTFFGRGVDWILYTQCIPTMYSTSAGFLRVEVLEPSTRWA